MMTIDVARVLASHAELADRSCAPHAQGLQGSSILAIAREVQAMRAEGRQVFNLTIGDFNPTQFPIPQALREGIKLALDAGATNYPPAVGTPELRDAVRALYKRELGLDLPEGSIIAGSGARPPIYAAFATLVAPGDTVVFPVPSWNVNYYCYLNRANGVPLVTSPETGFMPTAEQILPHLREARLIVINSPQNPSGTVIDPEQMTQICDAIVAENRRRNAAGERPVFLLYDQVYWQLTFGGAQHANPVALVPEMAPYTIMVDAISKWWAATGLRVGWGVAPPWIIKKMQALIGHMGAWPARAEQLATATLLREPELLGDFPVHFKRQVQTRLERLQRGIEDMARDGLPVRALDAAGAIYLSVQLDLIGRTTPDGETLDDDESVRSWLLRNAGVAVVPFTAFGYPGGSGWIRMSVGSVALDELDGTLAALREVLTPFAS